MCVSFRVLPCLIHVLLPAVPLSLPTSLLSLFPSFIFYPPPSLSSSVSPPCLSPSSPSCPPPPVLQRALSESVQGDFPSLLTMQLRPRVADPAPAHRMISNLLASLKTSGETHTHTHTVDHSYSITQVDASHIQQSYN